MLEKNFATFLSDLCTSLGQKQTAVKFRISCKDDNIKSVLNVDLSPLVYEVVALSGEISYAGKVAAKLIVEEENGTVTGLNFTADFSDEYKNDAVTTESSARAACILLDSSYEIEGSEVLVTAVVGTDFYVSQKKENTYVDGGNFSYRLCSVDFGRVTAKIEDSFSASFEMDIKENVAKVLSYKSNAVVNAASVADGVLTVDGEILLNLVYLPVESKQIKNELVSFPFSQEFAVSGEGIANVTARVKTTKVHLDVVEDSATTVVSAELIVVLDGAIIFGDSAQAVCDAYSVTNETALTNGAAVSTVSFGVSGKLISVNGETEIDDISAIDGVAGLNVLISDTKCNDGSITVEGTVSGNLFYLQGENTASQSFEIPFSTVLETPLVNIGCWAEIYGVVKQFSADPRNGKIDIAADVALTVNVKQNLMQSFVADISEGEAVESASAAIEVCIANKGDSIWDVAKSLNMTTEDILRLNPELSDPLENDEKLVIYHQKTA